MNFSVFFFEGNEFEYFNIDNNNGFNNNDDDEFECWIWMELMLIVPRI